MGEQEQARNGTPTTPMEHVGVWTMDELKVSRDDNTCKIYHKSAITKGATMT